MTTSNYATPASGEPQGWRYGSGVAIYTERFANGRLLCGGYEDNGIPVMAAHELANEPSFDLVVDGESLCSGWEAVGFTSEREPQDVAAGTLTLRHTRKPVELTVVTRAGGEGFFRRQLRLRNTSTDRSLGLTAITPLRGVLWRTRDNLMETLRDRTVTPYAVGHFKDRDWGNEGNFAWQDIPMNTEVAYESRSGRSGHSSPFFVLKNHLGGGYFLGHLGWSGNWRMSFESDFAVRENQLCLRFGLGPTAPPPMRVIGPGESVCAPEVFFGLCHEDFDATIQRWHSFVRRHVLRRVGDGRQPVIVNHWGYMQHEVSEPRLKAEIDMAAEIGAEMFIVDAGWYAGVGTPWPNTTGDWDAGDRLPNDLFPVFEHARKKGLMCGLWGELESAGKDSRLAREHPDWFIRRYGHPVERILDLTRPGVAEYVETTVNRLIERYKLDLFRLDYNVRPREGGFNNVAGLDENTLWRHVETIYAIFDRVGRRHPHVQLENCAGGGGRTDLGIVSRFTTTWVSDWGRMPRTVRILNGMTMLLPPEYVDRFTGAVMEASYRGNPDTLMHAIILSHPMISGLTPTLAEANPEMTARVRKYVGLYKDFIRPFHREALVYHHTPEIPGAEGSGWCAIEYVAPDARRAVAAVFRLVHATEDTYHLAFRGLDPARRYGVTTEPDGRRFIASGRELTQQGVDVRLDTALTSKLFLLEAED